MWDVVTQTDGHLRGELTIPIGVRAAVIVVRLQADLKDIVLENLALIGADSDEPDIYPTCADIQYHGGQYPLAALAAIATSESSTDAIFAASYLRERFMSTLELSYLLLLQRLYLHRA